MAPWFEFGVFAERPDSAWVERVVSDLSDFRDRGVIDDTYFREAWLRLRLAAIADDPFLQGEHERGWAIEFLRSRSGLPAERTQVTADDVFGRTDEHGEPSTFRRPGGGEIIHFDPGFALAGRRWEFHLTDKDSNRPAPHGHDKEDHRIVLDPYTGAVTGGNGESLGSAKPKEVAKLWRDTKFRDFATQARAVMQAQQPWRTDAIPHLPAEAKD